MGSRNRKGNNSKVDSLEDLSANESKSSITGSNSSISKKTTGKSKSNKKRNNAYNKEKKNMNQTSLLNSRYASVFGIFILIFGIIYLIIYISFFHKLRKHEIPSLLNNHPPHMVVKDDETGEFKTISINDFDIGKLMEELNEKKMAEGGEMGNEEPTNDMNNGNEEGSEDSNENNVYVDVNGEAIKNRQRRSYNYLNRKNKDSINNDEMSSYLSDLLKKGPSASFTDQLRNKIAIINGAEGGDITSTEKIKKNTRHSRSINQHLYAGGNRNKKNICYNINSMNTNICY